MCGIMGLGIRSSYTESQFVKDHRLTNMHQSAWFQLFKKMNEKYTKVLLRMMDSKVMEQAITQWANREGAVRLSVNAA